MQHRDSKRVQAPVRVCIIVDQCKNLLGVQVLYCHLRSLRLANGCEGLEQAQDWGARLTCTASEGALCQPLKLNCCFFSAPALLLQTHTMDQIGVCYN